MQGTHHRCHAIWHILLGGYAIRPYQRPATFQKIMDRILSNIHYARTYLEHVVIHFRTLQEHLEHIMCSRCSCSVLRSDTLSMMEGVSERIRGHQLKLRVEKCTFCAAAVDLLEHVVTSNGVKTDPKKIEAVWKAPGPKDRSGARNFLGLPGYYRRSIGALLEFIPL